MSTKHGCRKALIVLSALSLVACAEKHGELATGAAGQHAAGNAAGAGAAGNGKPSTNAEPARVGANATVTLVPTTVTTSDGDAAVPVSGTGSFHETSLGVDVTFQTLGCVLGTTYLVFIQDGSDCTDATLTGAHWDSPRGEGISGVQCTGTTGIGRGFYSRVKDDKQPWTIGSPAASNILGHALVLYDATGMQPLACGVIERSADAPSAADSASDAGVPTAVRASLAGLCLGRMIVRDNTQECPKPSELAKCASDHCGLDACVEQCTGYVACLKTQADPCDGTANCAFSDACIACQSQVTTCVEGFCNDVIACAAPVSPDGPCSQLEACCQLQGDGAAACLDTVHLLEKYSGDPSCFGVMHDWDSTAHLAVPCQFK